MPFIPLIKANPWLFLAIWIAVLSIATSSLDRTSPEAINLSVPESNLTSDIMRALLAVLFLGRIMTLVFLVLDWFCKGEELLPVEEGFWPVVPVGGFLKIRRVMMVRADKMVIRMMP